MYMTMSHVCLPGETRTEGAQLSPLWQKRRDGWPPGQGFHLDSVSTNWGSAELLGYSDETAFNRAFSKWEGTNGASRRKHDF
jgi:hypothetical protein